MTYQFDTEFARRYGLQEAIFCQSLLYWIVKNAANERHWHTAEVTLPDGETATVEGYWMYNSAKAFTRLFPFWTARQIETIIKKCREKGLIYTANLSDKPIDRTTWYALTENVKCIYAKCEMDSTECVNPFTILRKCLKGTVKNTVENQERETSPLPDHGDGMADGRDPSACGLRMTGKEMADGRDPRVPRGVSLALGMTDGLGELKNVKLSREQLAKLKARYREADVARYIDELSLYLAQHPGKYRSHYAAILKWMRRDGVRERPEYGMKNGRDLRLTDGILRCAQNDSGLAQDDADEATGMTEKGAGKFRMEVVNGEEVAVICDGG